MAVSKVLYGTQTLVDLTGDTVTPQTLAMGITAHGKDGSLLVGTLETGGGREDLPRFILWGSYQAYIGNYEDGTQAPFSRPADAWVRAAMAGGCYVYCDSFGISANLNYDSSDYYNMTNSVLYGMWFIHCPDQSSSTGQTGNYDFPCTGIAMELLYSSGWVRGWCNAVDYDTGSAEIQGNIKTMGLTLEGWYKVFPRRNVMNSGTTWVWYPLEGGEGNDAV